MYEPYSEEELAQIRADVESDGPDPTAEMVGRLIATVDTAKKFKRYEVQSDVPVRLTVYARDPDHADEVARSVVRGALVAIRAKRHDAHSLPASRIALRKAQL